MKRSTSKRLIRRLKYGGKHSCKNPSMSIDECNKYKYGESDVKLCKSSGLIGFRTCNINTELFADVINNLYKCIVNDYYGGFKLDIQDDYKAPSLDGLLNYDSILNPSDIQNVFKGPNLDGLDYNSILKPLDINNDTSIDKLKIIFKDLNGLTDKYKYSFVIGQFLSKSTTQEIQETQETHEDIILNYLKNDYTYFINELFKKYRETHDDLDEKKLEVDKKKFLFVYNRLIINNNVNDDEEFKEKDTIINDNDTDYKTYTIIKRIIDDNKKTNLLKLFSDILKTINDIDSIKDINDIDSINDIKNFHTTFKYFLEKVCFEDDSSYNQHRILEYTAFLNTTISKREHQEELEIIKTKLLEIINQLIIDEKDLNEKINKKLLLDENDKLLSDEYEQTLIAEQKQLLRDKPKQLIYNIKNILITENKNGLEIIENYIKDHKTYYIEYEEYSSTIRENSNLNKVSSTGDKPDDEDYWRGIEYKSVNVPYALILIILQLVDTIVNTERDVIEYEVIENETDGKGVVSKLKDDGNMFKMNNDDMPNILSLVSYSDKYKEEELFKDFIRWEEGPDKIDIFRNDIMCLFFQKIYDKYYETYNAVYDESYPRITQDELNTYLPVDETIQNMNERIKKTYFTLQPYIDSKIIDSCKSTSYPNRILIFILFGIILYVFSHTHNNEYNNLGAKQKEEMDKIDDNYVLMVLLKTLLSERDNSKQINLLVSFISTFITNKNEKLAYDTKIVKDTINITNIDRVFRVVKGIKNASSGIITYAHEGMKNLKSSFERKPYLTTAALIVLLGVGAYRSQQPQSKYKWGAWKRGGSSLRIIPRVGNKYKRSKRRFNNSVISMTSKKNQINKSIHKKYNRYNF